jgi:tetratricopeptide (TPR) repeat protein
MQERSESVLLQRAFVGREHELLELRQGLREVLAGAGRLFLISGEPGIGKTRLAEELGAEALALGARVIWGRCWAGDGAPAYWPWIQVVRSCLGEADSARIDSLLKSEAPQVVDLLPEVNQLRRSSAVAPRLHAVPSSNPEEERFRLFDSLARLLKSIADAQPLMIVLDDLQEADQTSLLMLRFSARQLGQTRVLLIAIYREAEVRNSPALSRLIGEIAREGHELLLRGLSDLELTSWVEMRGGLNVGPALITALIRATGGNPLFIDGILRTLAAEGGKVDHRELGIHDLRLPGGVHESIRRRVGFLSNEVNEVLSIAAVIGQEFEFECLRRIVEVDATALIDTLNEARRDGLIHPVLDGGVSYRFAHDLSRETIYNDLPASSRLMLHLKAGEALEALHSSDLTPHLAELAHHYRESVTVGGPPKAIDYSVRAGDAGLAVFAYDEAATEWRAALNLMKSYEANSARRADLLRKLGVMTFHACDHSEAVNYLQASLELAERLGEAHLTALAHAELGFARGSIGYGLHVNLPQALMHFKEAEALLRDEGELLTLGRIYPGIAWAAHRALEIEQGLAAARLGMGLSERLQNQALWNIAAANCATHLMVIGRHAEAEPLLDRAWKAALLIRDPEQSRSALWLVGMYYMWMRDPLEARQMFRLTLQRPGVSAYQRAWDSQFLASTEMFLGNLAEAQKLANSQMMPQSRSQIAFQAGDFEAARQLQLEHLNQHALKTGDTWNECNTLCYSINVLFVIGDYQGAEAALAQTIKAYRPEDAYWEMRTRPQAALLAVELGQYDKAVEHLEICRGILKAGENWRGWAGCVNRAEGVVQASIGKLEDADEQFQKAINNFQRYSLPWEVADTFHSWGRALLGVGENAGALEKLDAAIDIYRRHGGGQRWIDRVTDYRRHALDTATRPDAARQGGSTKTMLYTLCQEGDYWALSCSDKTVRLKDAKGLHHLAYLLRHPGVEVPATYLAGVNSYSIGGPNEPTNGGDFGGVHYDLGDAGPQLDARAKADYTRRIKELQAELTEAERFNDIGRAERVRREIEALAAELRAATGPGGIDRRAASHAERARSTVSKRIRFAIRQVQKSSPALGNHLSKAIRTGYHCIYQPTESISWQF